MSDDSSSGRSLLEAARGARPTHLERARLRAGVDARVAAVGAAAVATSVALSAGSTASKVAGAGISTGASVAAPAGAGLFAKAIVAGALVSAVGASTWWLATRSSDVAPPHEVVATTAPPNVAPPPPSESEVALVASASAPEPTPSPAPSGAATPSSLATSARTPAAAASPSRDAASIANEIALLRQAQAAMKDGDSERSLAALDALAKKHPGGELREERLAARVLTLCAAGRLDEARAEGRRFVAEHPSSVHAVRVRASCAFAPAPASSRP
jgi:hypothetical protein